MSLVNSIFVDAMIADNNDVLDAKLLKGLNLKPFFSTILMSELIQSGKQSGKEQDLLFKNIYVGLSRATFYLGVTLKNELPQQFSFLDMAFSGESDNCKLP